MPRILPTSVRLIALVSVLSTCTAPSFAVGAPKPPQPKDTVVLENGDSITGILDREVSGTVYFKSDELGELTIPWAKIKTLQTRNGYVVLENTPGVRVRHFKAEAEHGTLSVTAGKVQVTPQSSNQTAAGAAQPVPAAIPVKNAQFILDEATFARQVNGNPNFFAGWNGSATAGITLVQGTENQYTYTSAVALVRTVPTVSWLQTRNRTSADFSSSYGEITQPAYVSAGTFVPAVYTKDSIFHADAERDEYVTARVYALAQTAFDHNFSQALDLQQVYGAGFGKTFIKRANQQLDLKATLQYEKQAFITSASGTNQNLIGSTLSGTYALKLKRGIVYNQQVAYVPAFNVLRAYSANETGTFTFPVYKKLAFTVGTIDSYLNDPVPAEPPTTRNSFQFTTGITYTIKSKY